MASTVSSTSSELRPNNLARWRRTTPAETRQGDKMPPVDSTTSPAFSQLQVGWNRKLGYLICIRRSSSRACAMLLALPQLRNISVSFGIEPHVAHDPSIWPSCTSCTHAPERQMRTNSTHDNTTLPGSNATPIVVKKCCRLSAFISHSRADSGRSAV